MGGIVGAKADGKRGDVGTWGLQQQHAGSSAWLVSWPAALRQPQRTQVELRKVIVRLAVAGGGLQRLHGRQLCHLLHQRRQQACFGAGCARRHAAALWQGVFRRVRGACRQCSNTGSHVASYNTWIMRGDDIWLMEGTTGTAKCEQHLAGMCRRRCRRRSLPPTWAGLFVRRILDLFWLRSGRRGVRHALRRRG